MTTGTVESAPATVSTEWNVERIRKDFPVLSTSVNGKPLVYLDNANTTQKPKQVLETLDDFDAARARLDAADPLAPFRERFVIELVLRIGFSLLIGLFLLAALFAILLFALVPATPAARGPRHKEVQSTKS